MPESLALTNTGGGSNLLAGLAWGETGRNVLLGFSWGTEGVWRGLQAWLGHSHLPTQLSSEETTQAPNLRVDDGHRVLPCSLSACRPSHPDPSFSSGNRHGCLSAGFPEEQAQPSWQQGGAHRQPPRRWPLDGLVAALETAPSRVASPLWLASALADPFLIEVLLCAPQLIM